MVMNELLFKEEETWLVIIQVLTAELCHGIQ